MAASQVKNDERRAQNEALFRDANEAVRAVQDDLGLTEGRMPFICECEDETCRTVVRISRADYERVHGHPARFLVSPGHDADTGNFVERHDDYCVVEKTGVAGEIASSRDPRGAA